MATNGKKSIAVIGMACLMLFAGCNRPVTETPPAASLIGNEDSDHELTRIAREALGDREGAVLVIDPRNGRIRAAINPRLAFEQAFPPGSAIKPFSALAAMRAGLISERTHHRCRGGYQRPGFEILCSHPRVDAPMGFDEALAYSCNDFFGTISERLSESAFLAGLRVFGFGVRTGINRTEAPGNLASADWNARLALGEGETFLATPIQLMTAYSAMLNGGKLFRPKVAAAKNFRPELRATLTIPAGHRKMILEGMRGTTRFGTARDAGYQPSSPPVFSKTGTSTTSNGFRTQGWFVAFSGRTALSVGVLVFLKRAHGSEGGSIARPIIDAALRSEDETKPVPVADLVKVHRVTENTTVELPLEEYIRGVVAVEGSTENELEALKSLAVVSRTYAERNRGRHAKDAYDFCSTTHCQRFADVEPSDLVVRAVKTTEAEMLRDARGGAIDAYFHASCGGATADIADLWGVTEPGYLHSVRDDFCRADGSERWVDRLRSPALLKALREDPRTDVGRRLDNIVVTRRDASGRAEWITLEGDHRRLVRGWDFKIIVGRGLGWNILKSSKFEVARSGDSFVFRGSGFGHGLGLCQGGAHVAARRGAGYRQILRHYFEGLAIGNEVGFRAEKEPRATYASLTLQGSGTYKSEFFGLKSPRGVAKTDLDRIMATLEGARVQLRARMKRAGLEVEERGLVEVVISATTADFIDETGQPGWAAAATRGATIVIQPPALLRRRGVLESTLRHEYAHIEIDRLGLGRTARWFAEGLAIYFAGEARGFSGVAPLSITEDELNRRLARPASREEMRQLYAECYRRVRELVNRDGEGAVLRKLGGARM